MLLQWVACGSWAVWARTGEGVISHVVCVGKLGLSAVRGCWQGVSGLSPESLRAVDQAVGRRGRGWFPCGARGGPRDVLGFPSC